MKNSNRGIYTRESSYFTKRSDSMINFMGFNNIGKKGKRKKIDKTTLTQNYIMRNSFVLKNINASLEKNNTFIDNLNKDYSNHKLNNAAVNGKTSDQKRVSRVDNSVTYEYIDFLVSVDEKNMENF